MNALRIRNIFLFSITSEYKCEGKKLGVEIENVRKDVRMRAESDPIMSNAWLLIYLIPILAIIMGVLSVLFIIITGAMPGPPSPPAPTALAVFPLVIVAGLLGIISFIVSIILRYKLVNRRNTHFKRQSFLYEDLISAVKTIAGKKGVDITVGLSACDRTVREARAEETEKSAVLWAILSAIPWIGTLIEWYINYFLMKDLYKHERREDGFLEDVSKVLSKTDVAFSLPKRREATPDRSFVLYLILTIITLGLFGIYWIYVLLKDPNEHFRYHVQVEDELLSALETIAI